MGVVLSRLLASVLLIFSEPSGARHWAQCIAPQPCIRLGPRGIQTMKQAFASGARLRSGRPILPTASKPGRSSGHRHLGSALTACRNVVTGRQRICLLLDLLELLLTFPVAARHRSGLRRLSPCARARSAAFWRAPRSSSSCAHPDQFEPGTIAPARYPFGTSRIAKRAGLTHGALGHCPPWQAPFPVASSHSRQESPSSRHSGPPPDDRAGCGSTPPEPTYRPFPIRLR